MKSKLPEKLDAHSPHWKMTNTINTLIDHLKDKNGKEIYEGDIIKVSSSSPNLELIEEVKWISDGDWMADKQPLVGFIHHSSIYKKPIEIIGNIYENPELLTN